MPQFSRKDDLIWNLVSSSSLGSRIWALLSPIYMNESGKAKLTCHNLGQVGIGSNIAQNHSSRSNKSYLDIIPIHMSILPKL